MFIKSKTETGIYPMGHIWGPLGERVTNYGEYKGNKIQVEYDMFNGKTIRKSTYVIDGKTLKQRHMIKDLLGKFKEVISRYTRIPEEIVKTIKK